MTGSIVQISEDRIWVQIPQAWSHLLSCQLRWMRIEKWLSSQMIYKFSRDLKGNLFLFRSSFWPSGQQPQTQQAQLCYVFYTHTHTNSKVSVGGIRVRIKDCSLLCRGSRAQDNCQPFGFQGLASNPLLWHQEGLPLSSPPESKQQVSVMLLFQHSARVLLGGGLDGGVTRKASCFLWSILKPMEHVPSSLLWLPHVVARIFFPL